MNDFFNDMRFNGINEEDAEFIPLLSQEDEDQMNNEKLPESVFILPLRNTVLFPGVVIPITVGRDKSIQLIRDAYKGSKIIGVVSQKNDAIEEPKPEDLNEVGTIAHIIKQLR
ncbi:MAG TPA: LON peptidase substrate-binding domain-containing protein, partial [Bacteroidia bacterium]|nr:LON peptidase substrate-binding domain-containing protein [Bacteroidia bacterium]